MLHCQLQNVYEANVHISLFIWSATVNSGHSSALAKTFFVVLYLTSHNIFPYHWIIQFVNNQKIKILPNIYYLLIQVHKVALICKCTCAIFGNELRTLSRLYQLWFYQLWIMFHHANFNSVHDICILHYAILYGHTQWHYQDAFIVCEADLFSLI